MRTNMAEYSITNGILEAKFNSKGAELRSLVRMTDKKEYMWSGDSAYWGRVSPVLFPFVGKLNQSRYRYQGTWYEGIAQHAFARDLEFTLKKQEKDIIWFSLESSAQTKKIYPFDFLFEIGYQLKGHSIEVLWRVENRSDREMHFSIGAHPAFLCMQGDTGKEGYQIDFHTEKQEMQSGELTADGTLGDVTKVLPLENGCLTVTEALFDKDALILEASDIKKVSLKEPGGKIFLSVSFDAPLVGIWSPAKKNAPFICIEPWYGRCDREGFSGELSEREYGNMLKKAEIFEKSYQIIVEQ